MHAEIIGASREFLQGNEYRYKGWFEGQTYTSTDEENIALVEKMKLYLSDGDMHTARDIARHIGVTPSKFINLIDMASERYPIAQDYIDGNSGKQEYCLLPAYFAKHEEGA